MLFGSQGVIWSMMKYDNHIKPDIKVMKCYEIWNLMKYENKIKPDIKMVKYDVLGRMMKYEEEKNKFTSTQVH